MYRCDETQLIMQIMNEARFSVEARSRIQQITEVLLKDQNRHKPWFGEMQDFIQSYGLESEEGLSLMVVAEALLRIPDTETANLLIEERLSDLSWLEKLDKDKKAFVRLSALGLSLGARFFEGFSTKKKGVVSTVQKLGVPVARQAIKQAMKSMGRHFVIGQDIQEALDMTSDIDWYGYRFSYDMLGEEARTQADADTYFQSYLSSIEAIAEEYQKGSTFELPGISIKLSALHPRYEILKSDRLKTELYQSVRQLVLAAKEKGFSVTIDAEESDRLLPSLEIFEALYLDPALGDWDGLGLAVQAYQKRSLFVVRWLIALTDTYRRKIAVRLVKGAYWDSEIKKAQQEGAEDYPVFTRKEGTDANYIACAKELLCARPVIFAQFGTHNAYTIASILEIADSLPGGKRDGFEFQRLYGMGHELYKDVINQYGMNVPCRTYAPVGKHKDLLPYLVRRLLENGANNSFVNLQHRQGTKLSDLLVDPVLALSRHKSYRNDQIPLPHDLYPDRPNSHGVDLSDPLVLNELQEQLSRYSDVRYEVKPLLSGEEKEGGSSFGRYNPANQSDLVGTVWQSSTSDIQDAYDQAWEGYKVWRHSTVQYRSELLIEIARLLEKHKQELYALAQREAGKTLPDLIAEVREAIDFCHYYAKQAFSVFEGPTVLPGITGELNEYKLSGRGVVTCISPWNFPIAIFVGQIVAALVTGNTVLAKPAEQTSLTAGFIVRLMHEAGVPPQVLHFIPGKGAEVGEALIQNKHLSMIAFTGSTETAKRLQQQALERPTGAIPFIAETGGQNIMIADSSALLEQLCDDVLHSSFGAAGQRCSALRVLYIPDVIASDFMTLLTGAIEQLSVGNPSILSTDLGPVIDGAAQQKILSHIKKFQLRGCVRTQNVTVPEGGIFVAPTVIELDTIKDIPEEVFGPVLHIIRYQSEQIDQILEEVSSLGYGLTFGIQSRLQRFIASICDRVDVGNIYVNRSMTGAIVGVQPFGGDRKSGTGPKAGGPLYLSRFVKEQSISTNLTAVGGNLELLNQA